MKEELFVSGRNIPNIDPYLHIWHWQIPHLSFPGWFGSGNPFPCRGLYHPWQRQRNAGNSKMGSVYSSICPDYRFIHVVPRFKAQTLFLAIIHHHTA